MKTMQKTVVSAVAAAVLIGLGGRGIGRRGSTAGVTIRVTIRVTIGVG